MRVVRARDVEEIAADLPADDARIAAHWWKGPDEPGRLHAGIVTATPGGVTPAHVHEDGQIMIVIAGRGFVETATERVEIAAGDVVVAEAGEVHVHGATDGDALAHINIAGGAVTSAPAL